MKYKLIQAEPRRFALVFSTGDELASGLNEFSIAHTVVDGSFKAVGALSSVKLAWFNAGTNKYDLSVDLEEQVELLSLIGDVATYQGKPVVHAHVVVGLKDGSTRGGHLLRAVVNPTCEVFLEESPIELHKEVDEKSQLPLIAL